ncbi:VTT domain-containing protein [Pelagicoccus albus]|uniref:VTT domain-containing protein n=1 Tax=Pelagicoccus albus TaxID=415222 RepID=A0A7X1E812_9BACT|nr:VTT domain-containing protein [Pelagicoccus albus]MBC2605703.1 VTT domain-containing protein [Pelagicoccus albus]
MRIENLTPELLAGDGLRRNGFSKINVLGAGYGAAEALLFSEQMEEQSLNATILLDPVISPRLELIGDHSLNKAMKGFQLAWVWLLENAVPHFGSLDFLGKAKRVFSIDLSASESAFESGTAPVLLICSDSEDDCRFYLKVRPDAVFVSENVLESALLFLDSPRHSEDQSKPVPFEQLDLEPLDSLWAGLLLAIATFASEDLACIGGGLLASSGSVGLLTAILGCLLGIFFGDLGIYMIGRVFGTAALEIPLLKHLVSPRLLGKGDEFFERKGLLLVIATRFFPGSRVPTYFAAGVVKVNWIRFSFSLLVASAIWTPILVLSAYFFGDRFLDLFESMGVSSWLGLLAVFVSLLYLLRFAARLCSWKGRRLSYSKLQRSIRWEFWPMWVVYAPVVPYILWLALRNRSVSLPFSVNPCMPASGLVYESKIQILNLLQEHGAPVARFEAVELDLPLADKLDKLKSFLNRNNTNYPVALKPDVGQRGQGVVIAKSEADAVRFFENQREDTIIQEFVSGDEYGVFYRRFFSRKSGEVSSITDKRSTSVTGNGISTVEELVLSDSRAVLMARYFLKEYESQLNHVPKKGERFSLADIGTHSRGALFLDGKDLLTPELEAAVDAFSRVVPGFHFGRYDLRVPSPEHLKRGKGIRIIELNGITSEPTNMYDPQHGPFFGWSQLMEQWKAIFELAKENRLAGHEPVSKRFVVKLAWGHFRGVPSRDLS